jgi:hypothetical protein
VHTRPLPGGIGNYDDFVAEALRPGFVGLTIRIYSAVTQRWSIYWIDNKTGGLDANGHLTVPVVGGFENGIGIFTCDARSMENRLWCATNGRRLRKTVCFGSRRSQRTAAKRGKTIRCCDKHASLIELLHNKRASSCDGASLFIFIECFASLVTRRHRHLFGECGMRNLTSLESR